LSTSKKNFFEKNEREEKEKEFFAGQKKRKIKRWILQTNFTIIHAS